MSYGKLYNNLCFKFKYLNTKDLSIRKLSSTSRNPDAIFLEKCIESPIIVIPKSKKVDVIGPPNPKSNLRPIIRQRKLHETNMQQKLRKFQDETQEWNEKFWNEHNTKFVRERDAYIKSHLKVNDDRNNLTPEEMSEFYKKFLDNNWKTHVKKMYIIPSSSFENYPLDVVFIFVGVH
ncbi:hypothetical protein RN001_011447 [Aquatica leii]|uniref:APOPT family protein CG14806, mitochondrial n=1 Tax=Aquatica leii TaxID=1421715 RepID=A0AAN7SP33_9COLE|nr:hypothetical protein RN001_011447 [Aquatica leii]